MSKKQGTSAKSGGGFIGWIVFGLVVLILIGGVVAAMTGAFTDNDAKPKAETTDSGTAAKPATEAASGGTATPSTEGHSPGPPWRRHGPPGRP